MNYEELSIMSRRIRGVLDEMEQMQMTLMRMLNQMMSEIPTDQWMQDPELRRVAVILNEELDSSVQQQRRAIMNNIATYDEYTSLLRRFDYKLMNMR